MKNTFRISTFILSLLFLGCAPKEQGTEQAEQAGDISTVQLTQAQFDANGYALGKMEKRTFPEVVVSSGTIDVPPGNRASITTVLGGFVKKAPLLVGDQVKKGQTVLVLESQEFLRLQQQYLEIYNQLEFLESEYLRNQTLYGEKISSQKNYLAAKSRYETAKATLKGLSGQLRMLHISPEGVAAGNLVSELALMAPIAGTVAKTHISQGSYVSPTTEIMEIIDNGQLHLELIVFEKDILKVREGQPILFRVPGASAESFGGKVHLVGGSIDGGDRSIQVHGHLEATQARLLPGMFVEAQIMTDSTQGWSLPEEAVIATEGGALVLRLLSQKDGVYSFERMAVQRGSTFGGNTEIRADRDLGGDAQYLVKGAYDLIGG